MIKDLITSSTCSLWSAFWFKPVAVQSRGNKSTKDEKTQTGSNLRYFPNDTHPLFSRRFLQCRLYPLRYPVLLPGDYPWLLVCWACLECVSGCRRFGLIEAGVPAGHASLDSPSWGIRCGCRADPSHRSETSLQEKSACEEHSFMCKHVNTLQSACRLVSSCWSPEHRLQALLLPEQRQMLWAKLNHPKSDHENNVGLLVCTGSLFSVLPSKELEKDCMTHTFLYVHIKEDD